MFLKSVAVLQLITGTVLCYYVILERTEHVYLSKKYLVYGRMSIKKYNRQSPYYLNIAAQNKHLWTNNITGTISLKEKLSNMYKPTFVEFRFPLCDMINNEHIFGTMLRGTGLVCPIPPGEYNLQNMTVTMEDFPNVFPFEKGRADIIGEITDTKEIFYKSYIYFSLTKKKPRRH